MPRKVLARKPVANPMEETTPLSDAPQPYYPMTTPKRNWTNTILVTLLIVASFIIGTLWQQLKEKNTPTTATGTQAQQQQAQVEPTVSMDTIKEVFKKEIIKFGDGNRKVLFIAVEDPSCPYCSIASGLNSELNKSAGTQFLLVSDGGTYVAPIVEMKKLVDSGKASFAYIYSPGHGAGEMGTKAMYCAFEKGKFWPVHDKLVTADGYKLLNDVVKNDKAQSQAVADFLKNDMNPTELKTCLDGGTYDGRIASDTALARSLGVNGTPGFFVNTTRFAGAYSYKDMESVVAEALK